MLHVILGTVEQLWEQSSTTLQNLCFIYIVVVRMKVARKEAAALFPLRAIRHEN